MAGFIVFFIMTESKLFWKEKEKENTNPKNKTRGKYLEFTWTTT